MDIIFSMWKKRYKVFINMKLCNKCNIEKTLDNFTFRRDTERHESKCKECIKKYLKEYYIRNKKLMLDRANLYYEENHDRKLNYSKNYRDSNVEKIKERKKIYHINNSEKIKEKVKNWKKNNRQKINDQEKNRRRTDVIYKMIHNLRCRTNSYFNKKNINKKNKSFEIIGCSPKFLKEFLEKKFTDGMSWDDMGRKIHIDHIIPLSSAKTEEEIYKLCHYTNLQPLWAEENLKKSNKIINELIT